MTDELKELEQKAAALDAEVSAAGQPITTAPGETPTAAAPLNSPEQIVGLLTMAVGMLAPMFPSVGKVYTPETINAVAAVSVPLANKHGFNIGRLLGKWAEEVAFAGVMIPLGIATYQAVLSDLNQSQQPAPTPPGKPATPVEPPKVEQ